MKPYDIQLETHFKQVGLRKPNKDEETITSFSRDIFWYDRDEVQRQMENEARTGTTKITYEDHRKAVETAINMMRKDTIHDIAMCILTHRYFAAYRSSAFKGLGGFLADYSFIVKKIAMLFNTNSSTVKVTNFSTRLKEFTEPTLVQLNHVVGTIEPVAVPTSKTLSEWALAFNQAANVTTTYVVAGLKIGA